MSPTVFRQGRYRYYFNSREEDRMHVHVESSDGEVKIWLEPRRITASRIAKYPRSSKSYRSDTVKSKNAGVITEDLEVTSISKHGFWLYLGSREMFVSFQDFPWFADAPVAKITNVQWPSPNHLYWPELDVDLSVDSIERPNDFPIVFEPSPRLTSS